MLMKPASGTKKGPDVALFYHLKPLPREKGPELVSVSMVLALKPSEHAMPQVPGLRVSDVADEMAGL